MQKKLYIILFLYLFILRGYAASHFYYHFKQLSIKEELPTSVTSLFDDQKGSLWIGTPQGIYRFNGEKIKKYALPHLLSRNNHYIEQIFGDSEDRIWVVTSQGICYYEYEKDTLRIFLRHRKPVKAFVIVEENDRLLIPASDTLLIYNKQLEVCKSIPIKMTGGHIIRMENFDPLHYLVVDSKRKIMLLHKETGEVTDAPFEDSTHVYDLYKDSSERYWISLYGEGVKCYDRDGHLLAAYDSSSSDLSHNVVLDITEWDKAIWLATDGGGVNIIYPDTREVQVLSNTNTRQFPANSVACLYHSNDYLWIGMVREGVLGVEKGFITTYTKAVQDAVSGLSDKCPLCLWEDSDGQIWIGTDGGGVNRFDPETDRFTHYAQTRGEKIVSICPLSEIELLVSSFSKGLFRLNKKTGDYRRLSLPDSEVEAKLINSGAPVNLRMTDHHEIELYGNAFYRYIHADRQLIPISSVDSRLQPSWVYMGNFRGAPFFHDRRNVFRYDEERDKYELVTYEQDSQILAADIDSLGTLWIAGPGGVTRLCLLSGHRELLKLPDGNDVITSLVVDHEGVVWMGSLGVIYAYDAHKKHFMIYNEMDGVLPNDFLAKPVWVTGDENVYMGGSEGLVRINKHLKPAVVSLPITLTLQDVALDGAFIPFHDRSDLHIPHDFSSLQVNALLKGENVLHKRIYRFRIKGLNDEYIETPHPHYTLHTIAPGHYQVTVQCTQRNGDWSSEFVLLNFTVVPPWWKQPWFVIACLAVVVLAIVSGIHYRDEYLKREYSEKERTVYKEKVKALININHELRTPLTLIYTPLKQLTGSKQIPYELRDKLFGVFKQARQMKNLIDMILNLRKMEVEKSILRMSSAPFNEWLQSVLNDFKDEYALRHISLVFTPDATIDTMFFDPVQCEIILNNLLTNANKFSEEHSIVTVSTRLDNAENCIWVTVRDEGMGFHEEDLAHLFTRFYQGKYRSQGTGLGLSYAKQLVEMHGGTIGAQNNEGKGATIFFTLPYRQEGDDIESTPQTYLNDALRLSVRTNEAYNESGEVEKFHSILVVEDDRDLCNFLISNLQVMFEEVYEAHDGMEALPILASRCPQLVISDVNMPRMNGFELCRFIKQKPELNYMPVVLLTSYVDSAGMEEGYKMGAEAYITKPFDMDLLLIQIRNIMHNHNYVKRHYANIAPSMQPEEVLNHADEQLVIRLNHIISENIGNVDMDVVFIAQQMGMSRASLYNKVKGVLDMGISEYIVKSRLRYAASLLDTTTLSVGEIAEKSGFKHSHNFSTAFKNMVGLSPSDYRKSKSRPS